MWTAVFALVPYVVPEQAVRHAIRQIMQPAAGRSPEMMKTDRSARLVRWLGVFLIFLVVSGCARATRPPVDPAVLAVDPLGSVPQSRARIAAASIRPGERLEILALSGGGADGAFGAGVLRGWTESGNRPRFDIVTGVSTGALMSVFAFLGPRYL